MTALQGLKGHTDSDTDSDTDTDGGPSRPRRRPSRRVVVLALSAFGVVVVAAAVFVVAFSPVFGVRTVIVRGTHRLTVAQVRTAAHIAKGTPLVRLDTDAVAHRVDGLADVASTRVDTSFPSTVTIRVTERVPVAFVRSGDSDTLVDRTGDRFQPAGHTAPDGLPKLVVPSGAAGASATAAVAEVAAALPSAVRRQVLSIQALDPDAITLVLSRDRLVHWGSAAQTVQKARVLPVLLRHGASVIDVTDPDQPFTR